MATITSTTTARSAAGSVSVTAATVVDSAAPLTAEALARACGAHLDWVAQLADAGIVRADTASPPHQWRFHGDDLRQALEVRRLERDFGAGLDAAALILDMGREIRRLKAVLAVYDIPRS